MDKANKLALQCDSVYAGNNDNNNGDWDEWENKASETSSYRSGHSFSYLFIYIFSLCIYIFHIWYTVFGRPMSRQIFSLIFNVVHINLFCHWKITATIKAFYSSGHRSAKLYKRNNRNNKTDRKRGTNRKREKKRTNVTFIGSSEAYAWRARFRWYNTK